MRRDPLSSVRPLHFSPSPRGHRRIRRRSRDARLGIQYRQARSPFKVADKRRAKLWIVWDADLVGAIEEQIDPLTALLLRQLPAEVPRDHVRVAAMLRTVNM